MLLDWLGRRHRQENFSAAARLVEQAVDAVLSDPTKRTADLGGTRSTTAFASELSGEIDARAIR